MTPSLRSRVVEAGARAIDDEIGSEMREHLAHVLRKWPDTIESLADVALDAILDCLTENADEWFEVWSEWQDEDGDPKFVGLIAVLRNLE